MPIEFSCEQCQRLLRVPDGTSGKICACPACNHDCRIPAAKAQNTSLRELAIPCPNCQYLLKCDEKLLGTKGQCLSCGMVFAISQDVEEVRRSMQRLDWIFSCPRCNHLFEGKEEMRGRKGKCHSCGEIFSIEFRRPLKDATQPRLDAAKTNTLPTQTPESLSREHWPSKNAPSSEKKRVNQTNLPPTHAVSTNPVPKLSRHPDDLLQLECSQCGGILAVPIQATGKSTQCPFCKAAIRIPKIEPKPEPPSLPSNASPSWYADDDAPVDDPSHTLASPQPQGSEGINNRLESALVLSTPKGSLGPLPGRYYFALTILLICAVLLLGMTFLTLIQMRSSLAAFGLMTEIIGITVIFAVGVATVLRRFLPAIHLLLLAFFVPITPLFLLNPFGILLVLVYLSPIAKRDFR